MKDLNEVGQQAKVENEDGTITLFVDYGGKVFTQEYQSTFVLNNFYHCTIDDNFISNYNNDNIHKSTTHFTTADFTITKTTDVEREDYIKSAIKEIDNTDLRKKFINIIKNCRDTVTVNKKEIVKDILFKKANDINLIFTLEKDN